jgi:hypothetical protein
VIVDLAWKGYAAGIATDNTSIQSWLPCILFAEFVFYVLVLLV